MASESINDLGSQLLIEHAARLRKEIRGYFTHIVRKVLLQDRDLRTLVQDQGSVIRFAEQDIFAAPDDNLQTITTTSFMLQQQLHPGEDINRMKIHVPTPSDLDELDKDAIEAIRVPDSVYVERIKIGEDGVKTYGRLAISEATTFSYVNQGDEAEAQPTDLSGWLHLERRVNTSLDILSRLYEDTVNWDVIPQRIIDGGNIDRL